MVKFFLETFGCQMNRLDSELVESLLRGMAYERVDSWDDADLVLFNTCSVREHAESKVYSRLGLLRAVKRQRPDVLIAVMGCMAEQAGKRILERMEHVDVLCGPGHLHRLRELIEQAQVDKRRAVALSGQHADLSTPLPQIGAYARLEDLDADRSVSALSSPFQAYLRVTRGCNKFCSFCVVPHTRGPEVHRSPDEIIPEAKRLADCGVVEITLLGQTVNHYRYEYGDGRQMAFHDLLMRLHDAVPSVRRLRFVTSYPRDFTVETLEVMARAERVAKYLHLPAQSGSDAVLKRMNRGYTVEQYKALIDQARASVPGVQLVGDMVIGFCGETEADFEASLDLIRHARYMNCYMYKYSPRPGTAACRLYADDVPEPVKAERHARMFQLQNQICLANNRAMIGRTVEVLVDGPSKVTGRPADTSASRRKPGEVQLAGRTIGDQVMVFDGPASLAGQFVKVKVEHATTLTLHGCLDGREAGLCG